MLLPGKVRIHHNTCYDFVASLNRIENNRGFTPAKSPNLRISEWAEQALGQFSGEMRQLLSRFFGIETTHGMTLGGYVARWDPASSAAFVERLADVPAEDLLYRFLYYGIGPGSEITLQDTVELVRNEKEAVRFINEELTFPAQEKWQILQFVMDPEGMKGDLLTLLAWHQEHLYRDVEEQVGEFVGAAEEGLRDRLARYGEEYLSLLVPIDYSRRADAQVTLAVSYYQEVGQFISILDDVYLFGYRYFDLIEGKHAVLAGAQMFRTLADETRLNIIRLIAQRAWYGHELAQRLGISNSTVSHHVTLLVTQGLARSYREDNRVYFELRPEELKQVIGEAVDRILEEP